MWIYVLIIVILLVAGAIGWKLLRSRDNGIQTKMISVNDIEDVHHQISSQAMETSFAVFVFTPTRNGEAPLEVQFSIEKGVTGLDWILMSEPNKREKSRVIQFALDKGFEWQECEMNDWVYLRTEQGDLVGLCTALINDLYAAEAVLLKYGGFKLKG
jgi:hypothetical protein